MTRFVPALLLCVLTALAVPAAAQQQQSAYAAPTPAPNEYTDPAFTFFAPKGFVAANMPQHIPIKSGQPTVVALFGRKIGNDGAVTIMIQMEQFQGPLSGFEQVSENEMRDQADIFVRHKTLTTLSNGMPAYWLDVTIGSGFNTLKRYEYLWIDGVRGVQLALTARYGAITEQQAKAALSKASATAYPVNRY